MSDPTADAVPELDAAALAELDAFARKFDRELAAGITALALLAVLDADTPLYGYQIAKRLERGDSSVLAGKQSALYPVLRGLDAAGLLSSETQPSLSGPPRRYYRLTALGRAALQRCAARWRDTRRDLDALLGDPSA